MSTDFLCLPSSFLYLSGCAGSWLQHVGSLCVCVCECVCVSRSVVSNCLRPHGLYLARLLCPWNSPGKNTGVGSLSLLQGIFPTQRLNPGLLHCRQILYHLSYQGSPVYINVSLLQLRNLAQRSCMIFLKLHSGWVIEAERDPISWALTTFLEKKLPNEGGSLVSEV